jgi:hypothetical protein
MFGADLNVAEILDRFVPVPAAEGDWSAIVRDANVARPLRRRRLGAFAALAAALLTVALVALLAPSRHGAGSVVDRALAALGNGPVLHVVTRSPYPRYELIDLKTGERRSVYDELEEWSDPHRGVHSIGRAEGRVVYDSVWGVPEQDPALTSFMTGYREALSSGKARVAGEGDVGGSAVYWLQIGSVETPEAAAQFHQVAVDKETFAPVALRWVHGDEPGPVEPILRIEAEPEGAGNFDGVPKPKPFPDRGDVVGSTTIAAAEAGDGLDTPAMWAGSEVADLPLSLVRRQELKMDYAAEDNLPPETATGIQFVYGAVVNDHPDSTGQFVEIEEASSPVFAYGWSPTDPPLEAGYLRVKDFYAAAGSSRGDWYRGEVIVRGTYVVLQGYDRDAIVAAAKALEPVR